MPAEEQVQGLAPPPPKCDAECQRQKKLKEQEDEAQHDPVDPPGKPTCSGGNPALCSSRPDQPSETFGGYKDNTNATDSYTDTIYQNTLDRLGSVVGSVTQTGSLSMLQTSGMMLPDQISPCSFGTCAGGGFGGIGGSGIPLGGNGAGLAGGLVVASGLGVLMNDQSGSYGNSFDKLVRGLAGGGAAQPPDDDDPHDACAGPPGPPCKVVNGWPKQENGNCKECARKIKNMIGGDTRHITPQEPFPKLGSSTNDPDGTWFDHWAVVKDGRVYDGSTGPGGLPIKDFKAQWGENAPFSDFGF